MPRAEPFGRLRGDGRLVEFLLRKCDGERFDVRVTSRDRRPRRSRYLRRGTRRWAKMSQQVVLTRTVERRLELGRSVARAFSAMGPCARQREETQLREEMIDRLDDRSTLRISAG